MRRLAVVLMAAGLFGALPVLAAEQAQETMDTKEGARQCALEAQTMQEKIKRLQGEIDKGSKVYSAEDLKKLQDKLQETNKMLDDMSKGGN